MELFGVEEKQVQSNRSAIEIAKLPKKPNGYFFFIIQIRGYKHRHGPTKASPDQSKVHGLLFKFKSH